MAQRRRRGGRGGGKTRATGHEAEALAHQRSGVGEHGGTPSEVDAMGKDKRRQVVGHSYGPSRKSQVIFFAAVATILVVLIGGYALAIAAFDQPEESYSDRAPWSSANASSNPTPISPYTPCGEPPGPNPTAKQVCQKPTVGVTSD